MGPVNPSRRAARMIDVDGVRVHASGSSNLPIEALEHAYPFRVERYALWDDSAGSGKYRGGMGVVLKAFDESLHCVVAIKVLGSKAAREPNTAERLIREQQALSALGQAEAAIADYDAGKITHEQLTREQDADLRPVVIGQQDVGVLVRRCRRQASVSAAPSAVTAAM